MNKAISLLLSNGSGRNSILLLKATSGSRPPSFFRQSHATDGFRTSVCTHESRELHTDSAGGSQNTRKVTRRRRVHGTEFGWDNDTSAVSGRGGQVEDARHHASRPTAVNDREKFVPAAEAFLDKVEAALRPMERCNDVFEISRIRGKGPATDELGGRLTLTLRPGDGVYTLQIDEDARTVTLGSPVSGAYTYVLCAKTGNWVGMDDGHLLEGMLVRDLIRQCNGLPDF